MASSLDPVVWGPVATEPLLPQPASAAAASNIRKGTRRCDFMDETSSESAALGRGIASRAGLRNGTLAAAVPDVRLPQNLESQGLEGGSKSPACTRWSRGCAPGGTARDTDAGTPTFFLRARAASSRVRPEQPAVLLLSPAL